jgi:REP element-mobilizing transposase RayT
MRHPSRSFGDGERAVVGRAIAEIADHRDWTVLALAVRTEHVHVVIGAENSPEEVMTALKAAATRALKRVGIIVDGERVWSRHGSTRYLWNPRAVDDAVRYVMEGQDTPKS